MNDKNDYSSDKKQIFRAIFIPFNIAILIVLCFLFEKGMDLDFHTGGVFPRDIHHLWGVFTMVFVHADWSHLLNNVISLTILSSFLYFFYGKIATKVLVISYLVSGLILWVIGRDSWHIGASGLIYALAFFLFFSGLIRKYAPLIAVSFVVALIYGNMVWHIFPWENHDPISWEGHLAGGIIGTMLAVYYRRAEPQKPVKVWEEDDDDDTEYIFEDEESVTNDE
jgi:membrane associated rhomboid family serine protease